jgi:hypothetical protein
VLSCRCTSTRTSSANSSANFASNEDGAGPSTFFEEALEQSGAMAPCRAVGNNTPLYILPLPYGLGHQIIT